MKSFCVFLLETLKLREVNTLYNDFKEKLELRYKKMFPDSNFKVIDTKHIFDQIIKRSNPPNISGDKDNIPITIEELKHIFDVILDRFFRSKEEGGLIYQTGGYKINPKGEWEFQHKINLNDKDFRCVIYTISLNFENAVTNKGKIYKKVKNFNNFRFITILPSNTKGKDNPKYQYTNAIVENFNLETLNFIED